jgi:Uma2 family endonuclease
MSGCSALDRSVALFGAIDIVLGRSTVNSEQRPMSTSSVASPPRIASDERVVLRRVSWDTYERLLADDEGRRVPLMTYDRGVLELVTPSRRHELDSETITRIVDIVAAELGTPIQSTGATTYRLKELERGFEADASFYVQHEAQVRDRDELDLSIDPPPDLVVETEVSHSALGKLDLFAAMRIPEVWRWDSRRVSIFVLDQGRYRESQTSLALPVLTSEVLNRFLADSRTMLSPDWFRMVGNWAREQRDVPE